MPVVSVPEDFVWGINGHIGYGNHYEYPDYKWNGSFQLQKDLILEHQIDFYRINVRTDSNGELTYSSSNNTLHNTPFETILQLSEMHDFQLLVILEFNINYDKVTLTQAYNLGYQKANGFVSNYGNRVNYYVLGNELDRSVTRINPITGNIYDGDLLSHYDVAKFNKLAAYFRGMIDGIKSVNPNAHTVINNSGWKRWGFYELLESALPSINYDIVGLHWYSNMSTLPNEQDTEFPYRIKNGNMEDVPEKIHGITNKPIWITEINRGEGTYNGSEQLQSFWINKFIDDLNERHYVKGFFVYELFDETNLSGGESKYGIIKWNVPQTSNGYDYKLASKTYKFKIEETKFGYEDYIYALYRYVNLRPVPINDPNGINYWTNEFKNLNDLPDLLDLFMPVESYKHFIESLYNHLLDRESDSVGLNYWHNEMKNGVSREEVISKFCASQQFWELSGNNYKGFLERLYDKLHNRTIEPSAYNYFYNKLMNGVSKEDIVLEILSSDQYKTNFIKEQYQSLQGRQGETTGINYWLNLMNNGLSQQEVIKHFLMSKEFWIKSIKEGYVRRTGYQF